MGLGLLVVIVAGLLLFNYIRERGNVSQTGTETSTEELEGEPVVTVPTIHVVGSGENLWTIAEKYYRSGYNWVSIAKENKLPDSNMISVGQKLSIPKADIITIDDTKSSQTAGGELKANSYTVKKGDDLWHIAIQSYGDGYVWVKIAQANNLSDPNTIHPGNVLKLPR